jgi:murein DD-endopeptidase MepM/ murein hydrolase activator NlpD
LLLSATLMAVLAACGDESPPPSRHTADIALPDDGRRIEGVVEPGDTFAHLLDRHQVAEEDRQAFLAAVEPAFSSRLLRARHAYVVTLGPDARIRELTYRIDPDRFLQVVPAFAPATGGATAGKPGAAPATGGATAGKPGAAPATGGATVGKPGPAPTTGGATARFTTEIVSYRREVALVAIRGDVDREHPSLVAALDRAGEDVGLAVAIAELFGGDIDFYRDLQPGDSIEVVFEQVLRDGLRVGYGDVVAARLNNAGRLLSAFRFQPAGAKPAYYDAAGLSLKRFFLASPLKFEPRITSGFSYRRLHPVLGIRRPHLGADFGAPKGAPVVAIADASVVSARYTAGGGNTVTLRHAGGYESRYLHLSAFGPGIRAGARVSQGQVIGRVGATGLVTGAHLHYELLRNGTHVNPVAEQKRNPPGAPIAASDQPAFAALRASLDDRFVSAVDPVAAGPPQDASTN